ncbi:aldo/keto reductase [Planosporangium mesophilum]|uniref:NADP-dependent aryl-alcohol dehydrogenase n=1 Tax=Planosporangium mesophilum TaxID=689768 RepID=A0A8J3X173_9ACTN|nr:aldo/keto reductase [Planosporangium mesophilum]NJC85422.1 aldo/keto reductase [Planosporangium mesophilum]GII24067.1 NADP-dependent aryl-alcohol dehydrogenase [Planosporangium mesophilum]
MRRINNTDLDVFPLALGGNVFGWTADEERSVAVLDAYAQAGGNFIDTADSYSAWAPGNSGGESETIIGNWMAARGNRDRIVVATKVSQHPEAKGLARDTIRRAIDASLRRLRTDHVDLYYAHFDDADTPLEETVSALGELVREGKVRYLAASNYTAERLEEWLKITEAESLPRIVALQPHYNLVERATFEGGLRTVAARENLSVVPYYALASGFLTGKYRDGAAVDSPRAGGAAAYLNDKGRRVLAVLDEVAAAHGTSVATVALAWLAAQPTVVAPLASARTVEQLPDLLAVADLRLTDDELQRLTQASA